MYIPLIRAGHVHGHGHEWDLKESGELYSMAKLTTIYKNPRDGDLTVSQASYTEEDVKNHFSKETSEKVKILLAALKQKLTASEEAQAEQRNEIERLKRALLQAQERVDELATSQPTAASNDVEAAGLQEKLQLANHEVQNLKEQLRNESELARKERQRVSEQREAAEKELRQLKASLTDAYREQQKWESSYHSVKNEQGSITQEKETLENGLNILHEQLQKSNEKAQKQDEQLHRLAREKGELESEQRTLIDQLTAITQQARTLEGQLEATKRQLTDVLQQSDASTLSREEQLEQLVHEKMAVSNEKEQYKSEVQTLLSRLEESKKLLHAAQEQQHHHKLQNDKLVELLQNKEKQIFQLKEYELNFRKTISQKRDTEQALQRQQHERDLLLQEKQHLESTLKAVQEESTSLKKHVNDQHLALEQFEAKVRSLTENLSYEQDRKEILEQQINEGREKALQLQRQLETTQSRLGEEKALLAEREAKISASLEEKRQHVHRLAQEVELAKQTLVRGIRELKNIEARYLEAVKEKSIAQNEQRQTLERCHKQAEEIRSLNSEHKALQERERTLGFRNEQLKEQLEQEKERRTGLTAQLEELNALVRTRQTEREELENRIIAAEQDKAALASNLTILNEEKRALEDSCSRLAHQSERLLQENVERTATLAELEARCGLQERSLAETHEKLQEIERDKLQLQEQVQLLKGDLTKSGRRFEEAREVQEDLNLKLQALNQHCLEKESELQNRYMDLERLTSEHNLLKRRLEQMEETDQKSQEEITELQKHVKKKVQEMTLVEKQLEAQKSSQAHLESQLDNQREKVTNLEQLLNNQHEKEREFQNLLNETIKNCDAKVSKWEEKYFHLYNKWQAQESCLKDYQKLEERYNQMQTLLANLGNFIGNPLAGGAQGLPPLGGRPSLPTVGALENPLNEKKVPPAGSEGTLFDCTDSLPAPKIRETLF